MSCLFFPYFTSSCFVFKPSRLFSLSIKAWLIAIKFLFIIIIIFYFHFKDVSVIWTSFRQDFYIATFSRRASRGHEAARSEKHLRLLSDRAQTLHNDRTFYSKQSYCFCFFHFNGFWRRNDVTVLKANFQLSIMAQNVWYSERTHWDKVKCEEIIEKARSDLKI